MFTFDLQRFDSVVDDDYNLKQGLRNIITSLNSKIEGEYVMASNANMAIDDVVDTIINALQQSGGSSGSSKQEGIISVVSGDAYDNSIQLAYNGDGYVNFAQITVNRILFNENTLTVFRVDDFASGVVYALATNNYTAACLIVGFED